MSSGQWLLILALAGGAYAVRLLGLLGGQSLSHSPRLKALLSDIPGCLLVALIASSLYAAPQEEWIAALAAIAVAVISNSVVITMVAASCVLALIKVGMPF